MTEAAGLASRPAAGLLAAAAGRLAAVSETPRLDAELLLAEVLGLDRAGLVLRGDAALDSGVRARFDGLVARRAAGEPVAYLLGRRGFRSIELAVDARVLVPRPETELLVELGLELPAGASVLDVGTGSGAVALALKHERPDLTVRGFDVSPEAVAVAEGNAERLTLDVSFRVADLLDDAQPCDAVLANLPYVAERAVLPIDVAGFEPGLALYGGVDGLAVIRRLLAEVAERPWPARLGLEIGEDQGVVACGLVREAGFDRVELRRDLAGRDRLVVGWR